MTGQARILFVGKEQPLWAEFREHASGPESPWISEFAHTVPEALALASRASPTAVVVDAPWWDQSGLDIMDEVMRRFPETHRLMLSDMADTQAMLHCVGRGHQYLVRPCSLSTLLRALNQATALETWLLRGPARSLLGQMRMVPSLPYMYVQVVAELQAANASVERIGALIAEDPAITAKILQLANSAAFGLQIQVVEPAEAVTYLGLELTRAVVLFAHTFSRFDQVPLAGFSMESLWSHASLTGRFARQIVLAENRGIEQAEQAFTAGLLHDLGKLLLAANLPARFNQALALVRQERCRMWQAEERIFGASHAELGACLLGLWGLPTPTVQAVAWHHQPLRLLKSGFTPLTAVHAANVFSHQSGFEISPGGAMAADEDYLEKLGLGQRLKHWHRICFNT